MTIVFSKMTKKKKNISFGLGFNFSAGHNGVCMVVTFCWNTKIWHHTFIVVSSSRTEHFIFISTYSWTIYWTFRSIISNWACYGYKLPMRQKCTLIIFLIVTSFHWHAGIRHHAAIAIYSFRTLHIISITFGRTLNRTFISVTSNCTW